MITRIQTVTLYVRDQDAARAREEEKYDKALKKAKRERAPQPPCLLIVDSLTQTSYPAGMIGVGTGPQRTWAIRKEHPHASVQVQTRRSFALRIPRFVVGDGGPGLRRHSPSSLAVIES